MPFAPLPPAPPALTAPAAVPLEAALQQELEAVVASYGIPGASLAVRFRDGRLIRLAAGWADREAGRPMTPEHRLFTGSIGKTLVAALVLRQVQVGRLDLEAPLLRYLDREPWVARLPKAMQITLRHLLNHTAALPEYVELPGIWEEVARHPDRRWTPAERLAGLMDAPSQGEPGTTFAYADTHYILMGMVLERAVGQTLEAQQQALLDELGLNETHLADRRRLPKLASGYSALPAFFRMPPKVVRNGRYAFNPQLEWAGGGFASTAADLARWGAALYGGRVLEDASLQALVSQPVGTDFADGARYGLGVIVWETDRGPAWGHSGFVPGFNAVLQHLPQEGITLALLCNSDTALKAPGRSPHAVAQRLLKVARQGTGSAP